MQQGGPIAYTVYMRLSTATSGPINILGNAADAARWAHHICTCGCRCNEVGLSHMRMQLPIAMPGPASVLRTVADAIRWVH